MIISFSVQNFGSIKEKQTLSFEATKSTDLEDFYVVKAGKDLRLLKLALIYGANGSGKTTVLKALEFLEFLLHHQTRSKSDRIAVIPFEPFLFDEHTPNENTIFELDFIINDIRYNYEVEFNHRAIVKEELYIFNPNKANVFKRTTNVVQQLSHIVFGNKVKIDKSAAKFLEANTLWNECVLAGYAKTNISVEILSLLYQWVSNYLRTDVVTDYEIHEQFINTPDFFRNSLPILKNADFSISDIKIKKSENRSIKEDQLLFQHTVDGKHYTIPFELESQGTQRYFGISGLLQNLLRYNSINCIDELETSLHPDLYIHFLLTFLANAKQSQLIATTHNREILNNKDLFRNDAIWFTEKNAEQATQLYSLADFDSKIIRDTSSVYNAYKTGKLGAVPHLGDYYIDLDE